MLSDVAGVGCGVSRCRRGRHLESDPICRRAYTFPCMAMGPTRGGYRISERGGVRVTVKY